MAPDHEELPRNVRWEIAAICRYPAVAADTVRYEEDGGRRLVKFDFTTDELLDGNPAAPILDVEPIVFSYPSAAAIGRSSPSVYSDRTDFPRDLTHLNVAPDNQPASLCLARAGTQAIYDSGGVTAVLNRLGDWMADAKTGMLHADGWDPVPAVDMEECVLGYIDARALQEHAASHPEGGYGYICVGIAHVGHDSVFIHAETAVLDTNDEGQRRRAKDSMQRLGGQQDHFHTAVPAIFCWPSSYKIDPIPRFNRWTSIDELLHGLEASGLKDKAEVAALKLDILFSDEPDGSKPPDTDKAGKRAFLLIVGLWRPAPLDPTIVGLSDSEGARALELRAFYLERPIGDNDRWSGHTTVRQFLGMTPVTPSILEAVSGEPATPTFALLGAGALGSTFIDYAVRGGTSAIKVVDSDSLLSHNIARHRAGRGQVPLPKTVVADYLAQARVQDVQVDVTEADILGMTDEELASAVQGTSALVDTTANPLVRRILSRPFGVDIPVMRTEIFHRGRLGVSLVTRVGSDHTLNFLFQQLIALAAEGVESVKSWLRYEASRKYTDEELLLGFGCRSLTTKLPAYKVDAHAVAAFAVMKSRLESDVPLIAIHELDDDGLSLGTRLIPARPIAVFAGDQGLGGWTVKVLQSVLNDMHAQRKAQAPNETGGYLFGTIDEAAQEACVLAASPEPPGTNASPDHIKLAPWRRTRFEKAFMRRTANRLPPIGTWHSHPSSSPDASAIDWETIEGFKVLDAQRGLPTIMAITGATADRFYVEEP